VTGTVSEEFAVKCLKLGADDYVLKSNLTRLPTAILNSVRQRKLSADRLAAELALRHQNEELVKINRELDGFVYSVSHNLRAPLSSVLGLLNLAKEEGRVTPGPMQDYLSMMEKSITKLDDTIKEILNYSRNARLELVKEEVNLEELVKECIGKLSFHGGFDQMSILMECADNNILCWTDRYRLSMVLVNLLSNAIKYRDPLKMQPYVRIKINISDERIFIMFQDNGIGISTELLGKVFDMFYRGTEKSDGAGLGLFIVRETMEKLKGTIQVSSSLGNGATFELSIPNRKCSE
jgi:signal transduction histidine kinase